MGKLLYQVVLNNDAVKFNSDQAELLSEGQEAIDMLVQRLIAENRNVFIEIQGHTDATGSEDYNYELGLKRAESVRRHLSLQGIPLHRMSVISYGESEPVADNSTREGRRTNRRVVLLVLE
jgi:outer membrane protein OmpA-like peptidoglycan-associated protein